MPKTLQEIRQKLESHVGERLTLKANGGRKKVVTRFGTLIETYPAVFVVKLDEDLHNVERVSYSYADVLTDTVKIEFGN